MPYLGDPRVPDYIIAQLATVLQRGSRIRDDQDYRPPSPASPGSTSHRASYDFEKIERFGDVPAIEGTTDHGRFVPRERFSYWCFDLLFVICSDTAKGALRVGEALSEADRICVDRLGARKRVACLALPSLLERCRFTLVSYVADEALRGNLPFPRFVSFTCGCFAVAEPSCRAREEELLYVLRGLLHLRLWPGTLWVALSDSPSKYIDEQPSTSISLAVRCTSHCCAGIDPTLSPSALIADAVKRSTKAHLFHFFDIFCEIVAIPRKPPSIWVMTETARDASGAEGHTHAHSLSWGSAASGAASEGKAQELDARTLAKQCLKELRAEMGIGQ